jgi:hypothetical protein
MKVFYFFRKTSYLTRQENHIEPYPSLRDPGVHIIKINFIQGGVRSEQGTLAEGKGSVLVDLLIKIGCFVKKENIVSV